MQGTIVVSLTPKKTKFHQKNQKFYKKKQEKKRRDRIIRNNRKAKTEENDIYSQKEYGRHNGSKPFEIYDRFVIVDKDRRDVDQQFMTTKEYDYSFQCQEVEWRELEDYRYDNNYSTMLANSNTDNYHDMTMNSGIKIYETRSITRKQQLEIDDWYQARIDIEKARHNLEMTKIERSWMSDSCEYFDYQDPYDSDDSEYY
jgi:hypothetical protein